MKAGSLSFPRLTHEGRREVGGKVLSQLRRLQTGPNLCCGSVRSAVARQTLWRQAEEKRHFSAAVMSIKRRSYWCVAVHVAAAADGTAQVVKGDRRQTLL